MSRAIPVIITCFLVILALQNAEGQKQKKCPPWCVTRADASPKLLKLSFDWICKNGADCSPIQRGGPCYVKGNINAMASYAFNDYFQKTRVSGGFCDYGQVATLTNTDPSHGACNFSAHLTSNPR